MSESDPLDGAYCKKHNIYLCEECSFVASHTYIEDKLNGMLANETYNTGEYMGIKREERKMRETRDSKGRVRIDDKHSLDYDVEGILMEKGFKIIPFIVKSTNDDPIPDDEPRILFRGRDRLALTMLYYYRDLCVMDECTPYQLESIDKMIKEFKDWIDISLTMKQPGSTLGK